MGDLHGTRRRRRDEWIDKSLGQVRSALNLRLGLAILGLLACIAGLIVFTVVVTQVVWVVIFAVLLVVTLLDLAVISLRISQRRHEDRPK